MFTQSTTFIGSLENLSVVTSMRRSAEARRGTRRGEQNTLGVHPAVNTGAHGLPHVSKIVFDLFLAVQRQFVLNHHAGQGQTGLFAVAQHLGGRFKRMGHIDVARALFTKVFFVNDKAAADG